MNLTALCWCSPTLALRPTKWVPLSLNFREFLGNELRGGVKGKVGRRLGRREVRLGGGLARKELGSCPPESAARTQHSRKLVLGKPPLRSSAALPTPLSACSHRQEGNNQMAKSQPQLALNCQALAFHPPPLNPFPTNIYTHFKKSALHCE